MANFGLFFNNLIASEGGYNPDDVGLPGMYGIRLDSWQTYGRDLNADHVINAADIPLITLQDAYAFYKQFYWDKLYLDDVRDQNLSEIMFDHGVNAGTSRAAKMIQYILNTQFGKHVAIDGGIDNSRNDSETIAAINSVNSRDLFNAFKNMRTWYYTYLGNGNISSIPSAVQTFFRNQLRISPSNNYSQYLEGWLDRVGGFLYNNRKAIAGGSGILLTIGLAALIYSSQSK